jgi:hypothetical protein
LAAFPAGTAIALAAGYDPTLVIVGGLIAFGAVFAVNSAVHSYLILAYADGDRVAMNVGFYYMANAGGRLVGTVLSGLLYQWQGLEACLWASVAFVLAAGLLSRFLPGAPRAPEPREERPRRGGRSARRGLTRAVPRRFPGNVGGATVSMRGQVVGALVALVGIGLLAGCGGGDAVVPTAPGAPVADRVLGADELGLPGFSAAGEVEVVTSVEAALEGEECAPVRDASTRALEAADFEAVARRGFSADRGGAVSVVWQFATPAGAVAWNRETLAQNRDPKEECFPDVTRTGFESRMVPGLPGGTLTNVTQVVESGPSEAWNVLFTDGRFAYVVGAAGPPGTVTSEGVIAAAKRQYARRQG